MNKSRKESHFPELSPQGVREKTPLRMDKLKNHRSRNEVINLDFTKSIMIDHSLNDSDDSLASLNKNKTINFSKPKLKEMFKKKYSDTSSIKIDFEKQIGIKRKPRQLSDDFPQNGKQDDKSKDRLNDYGMTNKFKIDLMPHHNNMNASNNGDKIGTMFDVFENYKLNKLTHLNENSNQANGEYSPFDRMSRKIKTNNELSKDKYKFTNTPKNYVHQTEGFEDKMITMTMQPKINGDHSKKDGIRQMPDMQYHQADQFRNIHDVLMKVDSVPNILPQNN